MLSLDVSARARHGSVVVTLRGELDALDTARIAAAFAVITARGPNIIVDLVGLEFIDCGSLRMLADARKHAQEAGGDLLLAAPQEQVLGLLAATGLIRVFSVHASVDEAAAGPAGGTGSDRALDRLLQLAASGDHAAFEQLYRQLRRRVNALIYTVLRDSAQSEEVTQDVMLELWTKASHFDPARGSAVSWVMRIARYRAIDRVRAEQSARARIRKTGVAPVPVADVAQTVETSLERERVRHCLDGLTSLQRQSIMLAFYDGFSYSQVAGQLGLPLSTVKTRIRDGLTSLRSSME
jgi:RNA polymerase sigma-70 factor, ECF subfamily